MKENFIIYIYSDQSSETVFFFTDRIGYSFEIQGILMVSQDTSA